MKAKINNLHTCSWQLKGVYSYFTGCERVHHVEKYKTLEDNPSVCFCPYCGKRIYDLTNKIIDVNVAHNLNEQFKRVEVTPPKSEWWWTFTYGDPHSFYNLSKEKSGHENMCAYDLEELYMIIDAIEDELSHREIKPHYADWDVLFNEEGWSCKIFPIIEGGSKCHYLQGISRKDILGKKSLWYLENGYVYKDRTVGNVVFDG